MMNPTEILAAAVGVACAARLGLAATRFAREARSDCRESIADDARRALNAPGRLLR